MTREAPLGEVPAAARLRQGLLGLAILGTLGTALELLLLRHFDGALQLIPWVALAVLGVAIVLVGGARGRRAIEVARVLAVIVLVSSVVGVAVHVNANYEAGPLDFRYTAIWPGMSDLERWFLAITDTVGPSPTLAPMASAFMSMALLIATLGHPALAAMEQGLLSRSR
jgi:hypothetical protein